MRRLALPAGLALVFLLATGFYAWTASMGKLRAIDHDPPNYFGSVTEAFLHGQLSLLKTPAPELLALPNPKDPAANEKYRLHDASLYHGKFYLYWGVTPVILLYLPFRVLTGEYLSDALACLIFTSGGLLFYLLLLRRIREDYFPASRVWVTISVAFLMAFGNLAPYLLRRPLVYESAISCGYLAVAAYCFFLYMGACRGAWRAGYLWAAGAALGLAFLCRPNLGACTFALAGLAALSYRGERGRSGAGHPKLIGVVLGPLLLAVGVQAGYNFARFGSVVEFGLRYQLSSTHVKHYQLVSFTRTVLGGVFYLFNAPRFSPLFPFVTPNAGLGGLGGILKLGTAFLERFVPQWGGIEPVTGVLVLVPVLAVALLIGRWVRDGGIRAELRWFVAGILAAGTIIFTFDCCVIAPTMRYEVDFLPLFILVAGILILWADQQKKSGRLRFLFHAILPICVLYSVFVSAALSITGCDGGLQHHDPKQYAKVASLFAPVERWLIGGGPNVSGAVEARATPPHCVPNASNGEPLLVTGVVEAADFFQLRCVADPGTFVVAWDHWGRSLQLGTPFQLTAQQPFAIEIVTPVLFPLQYQRDQTLAKACVVRVNGQEVFRVENCDVYPAAPNQVFAFRNPVGASTCSKNYSGNVLSVERGLK